MSGLRVRTLDRFGLSDGIALRRNLLDPRRLLVGSTLYSPEPEGMQPFLR
jgi:hypothetical protein